MNNKLFMSALVGSHNYNLNIETSDDELDEVIKGQCLRYIRAI